MKFDSYTIVSLSHDPKNEYVLLSYPGMETNGTIVVAPLMPLEEIALVDTLHPVVETDKGKRVVVVERLAAILPELATPTQKTLIDFEYAIHRALSRLFFGN